MPFEQTLNSFGVLAGNRLHVRFSPRRHPFGSGPVRRYATISIAMLIVDTGPLLAYLNRNDSDHARRSKLIESRHDQLLVTHTS
ncbi:hypothetical protein [Nocardia sp. NPDC019395]|uniref:hypothetical protein n=1 Tax=Nocardia sp. NPDC019395 TaxID=3154686 RepID=UPI0033D3AB7D